MQNTEFNENNRIPLPVGTKLANLKITTLLSDCGGTSLTYLAKDDNGYTVVIKETYPLHSHTPIYRDGYRLVIDSDSKMESEEIKDINDKFEQECKNANILAVSGESNSIHHFECKDITTEVCVDKEFFGTIARYMKIATVSGRTLKEIRENDDISLKEGLLYVKEILLPLRRMHSKPKEMLHLDIKDDNLFFPNEKTFAIFLDSGSSQKIDKVSESARFSISDKFAAREVQLLKQYSSGRLANLNAANKYRKLIGTHTDLYSVGAILYMLVMAERFNEKSWSEINSEDDPNERKELIYADIGNALSEKYPYLIKRLCNIILKAIYFSPNSKDLINNRYTTCDEFINDINIVLEILEHKGIHPEIVAEKSKENFIRILRNANFYSPKENRSLTEDVINDDNLFVREWFPEIVEIRNENE